MESLETAIRSCWDYYAFEDALFLSEVYFYETQSDTALHLLATSYYRSGHVTSAYLLLKYRGTRTAETKYLFAKCCEDVDRYAEAEMAVEESSSSSGPESSTPFIRKLLGRIYSKTNRLVQSVDAHKQTLDTNPLLVSSLSALNTLGDSSVQIDELFNPASKFFKSLDHKRIITLNNAPVSSDNKFDGVRDENCSANAAFTPGTDLQATLPPRAPKKTTRRFNNDSSSQIVTRQRSTPIDQTGIATRRSNRLFQTSIKENEINMPAPPPIKTATRPRDNSNILLQSSRSRLRKLENEDLQRRGMHELNNHGSTTVATRRRAPLIEKLSKLDNLDENKLSSWKQHEPKHDQTKESQAETVDDKAQLPEADCTSFLAAFVELLKKYASIESALSRFDFPATLSLIDQLPLNHKTAPFCLMALGRTYFEMGDYSKAVKFFDDSHQKYDYYLKGVEYYSVALWHLQSILELSALAQELIERHPYAAETWCVAGNCFSMEKDQETAVKFFQRAIQLNAEFSYAYTLLGHEYVVMEEYEKAIQAFRSALKNQPRHYNAWYGLGLVYSKQEKHSLASHHFLRALSINPQNSVLLCSVAQQGEQCREKAMQYLDLALKSTPKNSLCRYFKAQMLFNAEKYDQALEEVQELKRLAPKESRVYFLAGKIYKKLGQSHLALMNFSWGTELDPRGEQHGDTITVGKSDRHLDNNIEAVTALAALESDDAIDLHAMESDDSTT